MDKGGGDGGGSLSDSVVYRYLQSDTSPRSSKLTQGTEMAVHA